MVLNVIDQIFSICKVRDYSEVALENEFVFIAKTDDENSLVCPSSVVPSNAYMRDDRWTAFRIEGVLDFSFIGILANISSALSEAKVGIFAVSTYNTDYIFVKENDFVRASRALLDKGYEIKMDPSSPLFDRIYKEEQA